MRSRSTDLRVEAIFFFMGKGIENKKLAISGNLDVAREFLAELLAKDFLRFLVGEPDDHPSIITNFGMVARLKFGFPVPHPGSLHQLKDRPLLDGVSRLMQVFETPVRKDERYLPDITVSMVPNAVRLPEQAQFFGNTSRKILVRAESGHHASRFTRMACSISSRWAST